MKHILTFALALFSCGAVFAAPQITSTAQVYTLENGVLQIKCIPLASGLISEFTSVPEKRPMMFPRRFNLVQDDLLPSRVSMRPCGMRELVDRTKMEYFNGYKVTAAKSDASGAVLTMTSRAFYRCNMLVNKTVTLPADSAKITIKMDFTSQADTAPVIFWINALANLDTVRDTTLVPVRKNVAERYKRGLNVVAENCIYVDKFIKPQTLQIAPLKPWFARISAKGKPGVLVLVMRGDAAKNLLAYGFVNAWKDELSPMHTTELRFNGPEMKKGDKWGFEYDYIYFANLKQLRDVAGDYGIDLQGNTLHIAGAVPLPAGEMSLQWDGGSAKVALPALKPGEVFKYTLPAGAKNISGIMPGGAAFDITPLRTEQLK